MNANQTATHAVSAADGELDNNAIGLCEGRRDNPGAVISLTPVDASGWAKMVRVRTNVIIKWLKLPSQPAFIHTVDSHIDPGLKLPRRFSQRDQRPLVSIRTQVGAHHRAGYLLHYGRLDETRSSLDSHIIKITPLGKWQYPVPAGATVIIENRSDPTDTLVAGVYANQAAVFMGTTAPIAFLKEGPN